jgi:hypothetical protein
MFDYNPVELPLPILTWAVLATKKSYQKIALLVAVANLYHPGGLFTDLVITC